MFFYTFTGLLFITHCNFGFLDTDSFCMNAEIFLPKIQNYLRVELMFNRFLLSDIMQIPLLFHCWVFPAYCLWIICKICIRLSWFAPKTLTSLFKVMICKISSKFQWFGSAFFSKRKLNQKPNFINEITTYSTLPINLCVRYQNMIFSNIKYLNINILGILLDIRGIRKKNYFFNLNVFRCMFLEQYPNIYIQII